jgi:hypothetical protein
MDIETENIELKKFLIDHGYDDRFEDSYCLELNHTLENGRIIRSRKKIKESTYLGFSWYWDRDMDEPYWVGKLYILKGLYPEDPFSSPYCNFEINNILKRFLPNFTKYEENLLRAFESQFNFPNRL